MGRRLQTSTDNKELTKKEQGYENLKEYIINKHLELYGDINRAISDGDNNQPHQDSERR